MKGKSLGKVSKLGQVLATYAPSVCSVFSPMLRLGKRCTSVSRAILCAQLPACLPGLLLEQISWSMCVVGASA